MRSAQRVRYWDVRRVFVKEADSGFWSSVVDCTILYHRPCLESQHTISSFQQEPPLPRCSQRAKGAPAPFFPAKIAPGSSLLGINRFAASRRVSEIQIHSIQNILGMYDLWCRQLDHLPPCSVGCRCKTCSISLQTSSYSAPCLFIL